MNKEDENKMKPKEKYKTVFGRTDFRRTRIERVFSQILTISHQSAKKNFVRKILRKISKKKFVLKKIANLDNSKKMKTSN